MLMMHPLMLSTFLKLWQLRAGKGRGGYQNVALRPASTPTLPPPDLLQLLDGSLLGQLLDQLHDALVEVSPLQPPGGRGGRSYTWQISTRCVIVLIQIRLETENTAGQRARICKRAHLLVETASLSSLLTGGLRAWGDHQQGGRIRERSDCVTFCQGCS